MNQPKRYMENKYKVRVIDKKTKNYVTLRFKDKADADDYFGRGQFTKYKTLKHISKTEDRKKRVAPRRKRVSLFGFDMSRY
jgi:hypothetical protein